MEILLDYWVLFHVNMLEYLVTAEYKNSLATWICSWKVHKECLQNVFYYVKWHLMGAARRMQSRAFLSLCGYIVLGPYILQNSRKQNSILVLLKDVPKGFYKKGKPTKIRWTEYKPPRWWSIANKIINIMLEELRYEPGTHCQFAKQPAYSFSKTLDISCEIQLFSGLSKLVVFSLIFLNPWWCVLLVKTFSTREAHQSRWFWRERSQGYKVTFDAKCWRPFPKLNNLSWSWPKRRLWHKEVLLLFVHRNDVHIGEVPTYLIGSSLAEIVTIYLIGSSFTEIVKTENTRISN